MLVIIMGVSGSGKTTLGQFFAKKCGWRFIDADKFHSERNVAKMRQGIPLNDNDRMPWLQALHAVVKSWKDKGESGILACSALKESYRNLLIHGRLKSQQVPGNVLVVYLKGDKEIIRERIKCRDGHFMPEELLDSQYETLEEPGYCRNTLYLSVENSLKDNVEVIAKTLSQVFGIKTFNITHKAAL